MYVYLYVYIYIYIHIHIYICAGSALEVGADRCLRKKRPFYPAQVTRSSPSPGRTSSASNLKRGSLGRQALPIRNVPFGRKKRPF